MTAPTITVPADYTAFAVVDTKELRRVVSLIGNGQLNDAAEAPDEVRKNNNLRAAWAAAALLTYTDRTFGRAESEEWGTLVGDFLADVMHLCDALGLDFQEMVASGLQPLRAGDTRRTLNAR